MSIFISKKVWKFLKKKSADKIWSNKGKGIKMPLPPSQIELSVWQASQLVPQTIMQVFFHSYKENFQLFSNLLLAKRLMNFILFTTLGWYIRLFFCLERKMVLDRDFHAFWMPFFPRGKRHEMGGLANERYKWKFYSHIGGGKGSIEIPEIPLFLWSCSNLWS